MASLGCHPLRPVDFATARQCLLTFSGLDRILYKIRDKTIPGLEYRPDYRIKSGLPSVTQEDDLPRLEHSVATPHAAEPSVSLQTPTESPAEECVVQSNPINLRDPPGYRFTGFEAAKSDGISVR